MANKPKPTAHTQAPTTPDIYALFQQFEARAEQRYARLEQAIATLTTRQTMLNPARPDGTPKDLDPDEPVQLFPEITHVRKRAFLMAFTMVLSIPKAAQLVGMDDRRHWEWLHKDEAYREAFARAQKIAGDRAEDRLYDVGLNGTKRGIYHQGVKVAEEEVVYPTLLLAIVNAALPEKYKYRQSTEVGLSPAMLAIHDQWHQLRLEQAEETPRALPAPEYIDVSPAHTPVPTPAPAPSRPWPTWPRSPVAPQPAAPIDRRTLTFQQLDALNQLRSSDEGDEDADDR